VHAREPQRVWATDRPSRHGRYWDRPRHHQAVRPAVRHRGRLRQPNTGGFFTFIADKISLGDAVRRDVPGLIGPPILDQFTFEVIGGFTHEFYKPFAVTFDFVDMNLYITGDLR
jgi:hypothetical protein